jgi:hypothetical protein
MLQLVGFYNIIANLIKLCALVGLNYNTITAFLKMPELVKDITDEFWC